MDHSLPTSVHAVRPPRQPARTRTSGLILIAFLLIVWFVGPVQLPTFFQRLVGLVNAILAMLVVVFAIREYGKKYNRLRWPLMGRVSTSKVAGSLTLLLVAAWWLSPWAPIQPGQVEPDLRRLLEQDLDDPLLMLADRDLAVIAPPIPSTAARQAATTLGRESSTYSRALAATAESRFDDAAALLDELGKSGSGRVDWREPVQAARAQIDLFAGRFAAASRRFGELLKSEPRRESYLGHGAIAAALAGDYATAEQRARQLLDQTSTRGQKSVRFAAAINLLDAILITQGKYAEARRLLEATGVGNAPTPSAEPQVAGGQSAAATNNQAVLRLLTGPPGAAGVSAAFSEAKKLRGDWNLLNGRPRDLADESAAIAEYNLGVLATVSERFDQAGEVLNAALAAQRQAVDGARAKNAAIGLNLNALADVARRQANYSLAESLSDQGDDAIPADDLARVGWLATRAALESDRGRFEKSMTRYQSAIKLIQRLAPQHPFAAIMRIRLGGAQLEALDRKAAGASIRAGLVGLEVAGLESPAARADALRLLGVIALEDGRRDDAQRQFDAAAKQLGIDADDAGQRREPTADLLAVAALRAARARLADSPQEYANAIADCEAAIAIVQNVFGPQAANHPRLAQYLYELATIDMRRDKLLAAEPLLRQALEIRERVVPDDKRRLAEVLEALAGVLEKSGRSDEARTFADRARHVRNEP